MAEASEKTRTFKQVGDLSLDADVYSFGEPTKCPVVVWIHGGALIFGHRETIPTWLMDACTASGFTLVSIDYRLAPETKLSEIVRDIEDALCWLRGDGLATPFEKGPIAVVGESAGGYLALTSGFRHQPPPAAIVSLWGYGDLIGDWYSRPSPHPVHHQIVLGRDEALRQVSGPPIADERHRAGDGYAFYQYCRQHGSWPEEVAGWDPDHERKKFFEFMPVENVSPEYPPTLLIHGTDDTDVPHDRSVAMASKLDMHGVEYRLISVEGAEHGLYGADETVIREAMTEAVRFLEHHLSERDSSSPTELGPGIAAADGRA